MFRLISKTFNVPRLSSSIRGFHSSSVALLQDKRIPAPRQDVSTVKEFLTKIGKEMKEHTEVFENDWAKFWSMGSLKMKAAGIDTQARKYILDWQERYRRGYQLYEIKKSYKRHGGERKLTQYLQAKLIKERAAEAKKRKLFKKARNEEVFKLSALEKLHKPGNESSIN